MPDKKHAVIIPLMGGLGNQLFQFVAGLHLHRHSSPHVKFSLSGLLDSRNTSRTYMLGDLLKKNDFTSRGRLFFAILRLLSFVHPKIWVSERDLQDFPIDRVSHQTRVLFGYFQRCVYVDDVAEAIIESLSQSNRFSALITVPQKNEIAVHIRFGDYLKSPETKRVHGLSAMSYYVHAVRLLLSNHEFDKIVIYSDDLQKAYSDFSDAFGPTSIPVIACTSSSELEDLAGMSSSKGIVISNSTFSWWAGWLGSRLRDCTVIAPRPWFALPSEADDNLLPGTWTVLDRELQP